MLPSGARVRPPWLLASAPDGDHASALFSSALPPQRQAYRLRLAPALASGRGVTSMLTPCGPSFRRCLDKTIVTSPSLWRVARRRTPPSSRRRPSGVGLARRWEHLLGDRGHEGPQRCAMRQCPCAWPGTDLGRALCGAQAPGGIGGTAGRRDDHDLRHPCGGDTVLPPLPKEPVLMPATQRVKACEGPWDPGPLPTGEAQDHLTSKHLWRMLALARRAAHGRRPAPRRGQRAVPAQRQDPVRRRREDTARGGCQVTPHGLRVPWSRPDHPHSRPICARGRQGRFAPRERACPGIAAHGHQQPTEDQKVLRLGATTVSLERGEHVGYLCAGGLWNPPGVALRCVVGCWLHPEYTGALLFSGSLR